jgi:hypothetical protein
MGSASDIQRTARHDPATGINGLFRSTDSHLLPVEGLRGVLKGGTVIPTGHDALTVTPSLSHGHVVAALGTARKALTASSAPTAIAAATSSWRCSSAASLIRSPSLPPQGRYRPLRRPPA